VSNRLEHSQIFLFFSPFSFNADEAVQRLLPRHFVIVIVVDGVGVVGVSSC